MKYYQAVYRTDAQDGFYNMMFISDHVEDRIKLQIENAIIEYFCEQMDLESGKKKPKPYYRKGRWE